MIGSRNIEVKEMEKYVPALCTEIVSGGADGVISVQENMQMRIILNLPSFFRRIVNMEGVHRSSGIKKLLIIPTK